MKYRLFFNGNVLFDMIIKKGISFALALVFCQHASCSQAILQGRRANKRAAIELWKANIPLKIIEDQLQMSERGLRNILTYAKKHP
jgi:hypothetical protein